MTLTLLNTKYTDNLIPLCGPYSPPPPMRHAFVSTLLAAPTSVIQIRGHDDRVLRDDAESTAGSASR